MGLQHQFHSLTKQEIRNSRDATANAFEYLCAFIRIVGGQVDEYTDPPNPAGRLRARCERPSGRTAEQRYELAPPCMSGKEHCEG
jgi:hypothetical protein